MKGKFHNEWPRLRGLSNMVKVSPVKLSPGIEPQNLALTAEKGSLERRQDFHR